jgi:hypothetical protein
MRKFSHGKRRRIGRGLEYQVFECDTESTRSFHEACGLVRPFMDSNQYGYEGYKKLISTVTVDTINDGLSSTVITGDDVKEGTTTIEHDAADRVSKNMMELAGRVLPQESPIMSTVRNVSSLLESEGDIPAEVFSKAQRLTAVLERMIVVDDVSHDLDTAIEQLNTVADYQTASQR